MDSFFAGIQDFISNPLSTPAGQLIEKVTTGEDGSENWAGYMEICDIINETEEGPKDAARSIRKQLTNNVGKNNSVVLYTIMVLETCVKNCGTRFHVLIAQKDFVQELVKIATTQKTNAVVVSDRILNLLQTWADAFGDVEELKEVGRAVQELKDKGVEFPMTDLDSFAPIYTPARSALAAETPPPLHPRQRVDPVDTASEADLLDVEFSDFGDLPSEAMSFHIPAPPLTPPATTDAAAVLNNEQKMKLETELVLVTQNCKVMGDMLSELVPGQESADDWVLLQELNKACRKMQTRIVGLIERVQNEDVTSELLSINDQLNNVLLRFDRFERLRSSQTRHATAPTLPSPTSNLQQSYAGVNTKTSSKGGVATGTLVELYDPNSAPGFSGSGESLTRAEDGDFDMFAKSRESFEQNRQDMHAADGNAYNRQQDDDEMLSGLGPAMALKSKVNPYQLETENDGDEMDEWQRANTLQLPARQSTQQQPSASSSEFDMFLATRATESEPLLDSQGFIAGSAQGEPTASPMKSGQRSSRGGRTLQKTDDDDAMFSL